MVAVRLRRKKAEMNKDEDRKQESLEETQSKVDTRFELCHYPEEVLKIGRDFQNKDGFRGAHYDTVKLLCDTIEWLCEQVAELSRQVAEKKGHEAE